MATIIETRAGSAERPGPRPVSMAALEEAALEIMRRAAIDIPDDYKSGIRAMMEAEEEELPRFVLQSMLENWEAASGDRRAMCADTGLPRYFVKCAEGAWPEGGFVRLEGALRRATARATREVPLRPNRVHPLTRKDLNNNVGIGAPEIEYAFEPGGDWIDLTTVHKGGLFGSDYRMLFPGDGVDGIKRMFLDTLVQFGRRGLACQPAIVGVGLGGSKDIAMTLGKKAACLRTVGSANPDPEIAELEAELKALGNSIGMGPMGFVGKSMVVQCNVEVAYTHTGGMPMSVHCFCLSSRRATARVFPDGRIEYRSDPMWFTDHMRREEVE
ncbi:MAG: fumarate hydratase [Geminicoccaceae bacterium]|nr:fumarate hydratase [Geminicoccaceae bacterium]